jgi:hypothetical protein
MATINFHWNGNDKQTFGTTISQYRSAVSGFFDTVTYKESWTGSSLGYASSASRPTSGTLQSWSFRDKDSDFSFTVTDLNLKLAPNSTYRSVVTSLFAGRDHWHGNGENNFFYWTVGGDTYHGGTGVDTLDAFTATKAQVLGEGPTFLRKGGSIQVTATGNLDVTLDSVERLRFSDISVALDLDGHAGTAARIAGAVFGRDGARGKELMDLAIALLDSGVTPIELMSLALRAKLGEDYTNASLVSLVYRNVTNAAPTAQEAAPYEAMLNDGHISGPELAWTAAASDINAINIDLAGLAASGVDYIPWHG